jgi:hypothetical protein
MFTIGYAYLSAPEVVFFGIFLFAVGEMISSPRIRIYIMLAPKEKPDCIWAQAFKPVWVVPQWCDLYFTLRLLQRYRPS